MKIQNLLIFGTILYLLSRGKKDDVSQGSGTDAPADKVNTSPDDVPTPPKDDPTSDYGEDTGIMPDVFDREEMETFFVEDEPSPAQELTM